MLPTRRNTIRRAIILGKLPIIYYMSIKAMDHITQELLNDGYSKETPCAVIYNAGGSDEEVIKTSL